MRKNISAIIIFILDILSLIFSFYIAYFLRENIFPLFVADLDVLPSAVYFFKFYYLLILYVALLFYHKFYSERLDLWAELKELIKTSLIWIILSFTVLSLLKNTNDASRVILILTGIISIVILITLRYIVKFFLYKTGIYKLRSALFIADTRKIHRIKKIITEINNNWYSGYVIEFVLVYKKNLYQKDFSHLHILKIHNIQKQKNDLYTVLQENNIKELFINNIEDSLLEKILKLNDEHIVEVKYIPSFHYIKVLNIGIQNIGDTFALVFKNNLASSVNIMTKKLFDFFVSLIILIFISPLLFFIALIVKLTSAGPVFYKAKRVGKNYKPIYVYKFRSMYKDADIRLQELLNNSKELRKEFEATYKLKNDPRITPLGKFLRKTSLDELPQLLNVLKQELSLVGPRPIVKDEIKKYGEHFDEIIKVRPGITGLWQVSGRSETDYETRVHLDLFYIRNWSLWLDIKIILQTIPAVLKGRGAY